MQIPTRFRVVGLLCLMMTIGFMSRTNISVAAPAIMKQMGWGEDLFGMIFSAFLIGFTVFQIPGGLAADKWGGRTVLTIAALGWSLFTALTPLAVSSFYFFLGIRFFVGIFQSATSPAMASINAKWVPQREFATAQMVGLAGSMFGQLIAFPLTTWIINQYSWSMVFYAYAVPGMLWALLWLNYSTNSPHQHASVTTAELEYIEGGRSEPRGGQDGETQPPFLMLLRSPGIILLSLSYSFWVYGAWMMIAWLPTYLVKARNFSLEQMGWVGMLPTVAAFAGIIGGGLISDHLFRAGRGVRISRQGFPSFSIALASILIVIAVSVDSPFYGVMFLVFFQMVNYFGTAGFWSTASVLYPSQIGVATGIMQCGGNLGGIFGPIVAGFLVAETSNWALPFYTVAISSLIAALLLFWGIKIKPTQSTRPEVIGISSERDLVCE